MANFLRLPTAPGLLGEYARPGRAPLPLCPMCSDRAGPAPGDMFAAVRTQGCAFLSDHSALRPLSPALFRSPPSPPAARPVGVASGSLPCQSGPPPDPLTMLVSWDFAASGGWLSRSYPTVIPPVIPEVIPCVISSRRPGGLCGSATTTFRGPATVAFTSGSSTFRSFGYCGSHARASPESLPRDFPAASSATGLADVPPRATKNSL